MKICAVIVTYNPNIAEFLAYYESNKREVSHTIIVDNSEDKATQKELYKLSNDLDTDVVQLFENMGIAYAQNIGIKKVQESNSYDFILFLDQDSLLSKGTTKTYLEYYTKLCQDYPIACIGVGCSGNPDSSESGAYEVQQIISSGSFCPVSVFTDVGLMDEELFIDFVEFDWCWRAVSQKYKIYSIKEIVLGHQEGDGKIKIFGQKIVVPSPIRHYYQYRNFLNLLHKPYVPLAWKIKMFFKIIIKTPIYIIFLDQKFKRLKFIVSGIKSYLLNEKGKYEDKDVLICAE